MTYHFILTEPSRFFYISGPKLMYQVIIYKDTLLISIQNDRDQNKSLKFQFPSIFDWNRQSILNTIKPYHNAPIDLGISRISQSFGEKSLKIFQMTWLSLWPSWFIFMFWSWIKAIHWTKQYNTSSTPPPTTYRLIKTANFRFVPRWSYRVENNVLNWSQSFAKFGPV